MYQFRTHCDQASGLKFHLPLNRVLSSLPWKYMEFSPICTLVISYPWTLFRAASSCDCLWSTQNEAETEVCSWPQSGRSREVMFPSWPIHHLFFPIRAEAGKRVRAWYGGREHERHIRRSNGRVQEHLLLKAALLAGRLYFPEPPLTTLNWKPPICLQKQLA